MRRAAQGSRLVHRLRPVEAPRIAVAVLVENGGFGASAAAPIARKVMDAYLLRQASRHRAADRRQADDPAE